MSSTYESVFFQTRMIIDIASAMADFGADKKEVNKVFQLAEEKAKTIELEHDRNTILKYLASKKADVLKMWQIRSKFARK